MDSIRWNDKVGNSQVSDNVDRLEGCLAYHGNMVRIDSWKQFYLLASKLISGRWLYRGESAVGRSITTSRERVLSLASSVNVKCLAKTESAIENIINELISRYSQFKITKAFSDERKTIRLFEHYVKGYLELKGEGDIGWLSVMQHYGTPTRLLDVTRSLFVALFFAFEHEKHRDRVIWAINEDCLRQSRYCLLRELNCAEDISACELANKCIERESVKTCGVIPIETPGNNRRIFMQNGLFLFPYNFRPLEEHLAATLGFRVNGKKGFDEVTLEQLNFCKVGMLQIVLADSLYDSSRNVLQQVNIEPCSIYPDLEGIAKGIAFFVR